MYSAVRVGDSVISICPNKFSGPFLTGSSDTFINNRPQVRLFDRSVPGIAITGSKNVFVNGRPAIRVIDQVVCGRIVKGSDNIFIN